RTAGVPLSCRFAIDYSALYSHRKPNQKPPRLRTRPARLLEPTCPLTVGRIRYSTSVFGPRWAQVRVRVEGKYVVAVRELETQTARCESSDPAQPLALVSFGSESGANTSPTADAHVALFRILPRQGKILGQGVRLMSDHRV